MKPPHSNPNANTFSFCPSCGTPGLAPASVKSFACGHCGFRFFINCASAAMALILDDLDRLLITRRQYEPGKGGRDLPGGFAEPGEGIEQALIREVKEELNLDVTRLSYFASFANTYPYACVTYPVTDMAFLCKVKHFDRMSAMDDVAEANFVRVSDLIPEQFAMTSARNVICRFKDWFTKERGNDPKR